jgi:signal transduction histidine kinase
VHESIENTTIIFKKKSKLAHELIIANQDNLSLTNELIIANEEKNNLSDELISAKRVKTNLADELIIANEQRNNLIAQLNIAKQEKSNRADELIIAKQEKINRADELLIANEEKSDRADELLIANEEKSDRADELIIAKQEKINRADELVIANKELAFQNKEKDKRADELVVANKELAFQNKEKDKRAEELVIANNQKVFLLRKLQLSQKMEALGKLTGGISHEYNNMLGIISGYSQLIKLAVTKNSKLNVYANEIQLAGKRAAKLTSKLLAFSQEKSANENSININSLLEQQHDMLEKTLTISISLIYMLQHNIWQVWLDGNDMEDAIINVCINAMHAMDEHGNLTIETINKRVNQEEAKKINIEPGDYVLLSFTDTGCGFDDKIKEKIFDPFFTTKGELGTGLGLSIVYSFVENSGGGVEVDSVESKGSQFRFYFPRYDDTQSNKNLTNEVSIPHILNDKDKDKGKESILLVDDEIALLSVTCKILTSSGYQVFCAENSQEALTILEHESINILISDVIMAKMDGYELAAIVQKKYSNIRIQLVSGFAGSRNEEMIDVNLQKNILNKPIDSDVLLERVRELIDTK